MSSQLATVPEERRRKAARYAGLLAALLLVVGIVPWVGDAPTGVRFLSVVVLLAAALFASMSWGLWRSFAVPAASRRVHESVDAAVLAAVADAGQQMCSCGVRHDPDEMHITDAHPAAAHPAGSHPADAHAAASHRTSAHAAADHGCAPDSPTCAHDCAACLLSSHTSPTSSQTN